MATVLVDLITVTRCRRWSDDDDKAFCVTSDVDRTGPSVTYVCVRVKCHDLNDDMCCYEHINPASVLARDQVFIHPARFY